MANEPYTYSPISALRSIRIFSLKPARQHDAPLCGSLREVTLPIEVLLDIGKDVVRQLGVDFLAAVAGQTVNVLVNPEVVHRSLREHDYEALSYVWGSRTGSLPLFCEDRIILITPNYDSAL